MTYLTRLSTSEVLHGIAPWDFTPATPIPDIVRTDKKTRDEWINAPSTKHHVYSLCEGLNPNLRITKVRPDGEGNPLAATGGQIADFDAAISEQDIRAYAARLPFHPCRIESTLSRNWRFVWLYADKLNIPSPAFYAHFQKNFGKFAFPVELGPGFDAGAWADPNRYYTNSCDWLTLTPEQHAATIPAETVRGWMVQASSTYQWTAKEIGVAVPLEVAGPELAKKFPGFAAWPGEFVLGSQGPTFWVEASKSPKSALVRETGIQTFSAHAPQAFYTWADLLGANFVKEYEANFFGRAVEGIYSDGKRYHWQNPDKEWRSNDKSDLFLHLKIDRKMSPKPDKRGSSDVEKCISHVRAYQCIAGAAPFVMRPYGIIEVNGVRYLNTLRASFARPSGQPEIWGDAGNFPYLSQFIGTIWHPVIGQLEVWQTWAGIFYRAIHSYVPQKGHALIMAGGVGVGKTLLNYIIGRLMGGLSDGSEYLTGKSNFNSGLLCSPYITSDDSTSSSNVSHKAHYSEQIKRLTANHIFQHTQKFKDDVSVEWYGRVGITCNDDEESIRQIPNIDISILEKMHILRCVAVPQVDIPPKLEMEDILTRELPHLAQFLLDHQVPEHLKGNSRYGMKEYCDPTLLKIAEQSGSTAGFNQILADFKHELFAVREPKRTCWEGTPFQLHKAILGDPTARDAMRRFDVDAVGRALAQLKSQGARIECFECEETGSRVWRLFPDSKTKKTK